LRRALQDAQAEAFELTEALADTREELDAVREINRELLADRNRPASSCSAVSPSASPTGRQASR
jgi:hypothetical protein